VMAATYEPIASTTLGSDAANVEFLSIASSWTDIIVVAVGQSAGAGTGADNLEIRVGNGSLDTGSNYSRTQLQGNGSSAASSRAASQTTIRASGFFPRASDSGTNPGIATAHIMSYTNTNVYKTVLTSATGTLYVDRRVHLWRSTSAIDVVRVYCTSTNLKAGTTVSLYGIQAA
jgi:hypothetical protein